MKTFTLMDQCNTSTDKVSVTILASLVDKYCRGDGVGAGASVLGEHRWQYDAVPNNLYRMISAVPPEGADYVLVEPRLFGSTKYDPILLKEWFYATKVGGIIVVPLIEEKSRQTMHEMLAWFYPSDALEVLEEQSEGGETVLVLKKVKQALASHDRVDSWTFGIITQGNRNEAVEEIIQSIHAQQIPHYEIIVCGTYFDRPEENVHYIHFTENDDKGWLTRKKNLICEAAQYENLAIVHDRTTFQPSWYEGMKRYGNYFDGLSCVQLLRSNGLRTFDWHVFHHTDIKAPPVRNPLLRARSSKGPFRKEMGLHYDDWDPKVIMNGGLTIFKHSLWKIVPWDESLFWGSPEFEDVVISHELYQAGAVIRFNPFSCCHNLYWRHSLVSVAKRDPHKLSNEFEPDEWPYIFFNAKYYAKQNITREFAKLKRALWEFLLPLKRFPRLWRVLRSLRKFPMG